MTIGLPPLPDDRVRDEDAEILKLIVTRLDLASDEELSRFARLYGARVQRMVTSGRMEINAGAVIAQEGDYFGRTVNIAARIADYAQPHEVSVSEDARQMAQINGVEFQLVGDVPLKGVPRLVRLHRALRQ